MSIHIKTGAEIRAMREGGKILGTLLEELCLKSKVGISTYELDEYAEKYIRAHSAIPAFKGYQGFPASICASVNDEVVHGIPKKERILKNGDLLTIDCGVIYEELYTDAARSIGIGKVSEETKILIKTAKQALTEAIKMAKPGIKLNKIGEAIEKCIKKAGFHVIHELTGHGVGRSLHEDPIILNYKSDEHNQILSEGMTLAIEPIFSAGTSKIKTLSDKWTISTKDGSTAVQEENTILITQKSNEILTCI